MKLKPTLIFGLTFLLLSCGQQTDNEVKLNTESSKLETESLSEKYELDTTT